MEQHPGDGSPTEADNSSPEGELSLSAASRRERLMSIADDPIIKAVLEANRQGIEAVISDDRSNPDSLIDPFSAYPPPLRPDVGAYRDPGVWKVDWREGLPEGHPFHVSDDKLITLESDEYWQGLRAAVKLGIAKQSKFSDFSE